MIELHDRAKFEANSRSPKEENRVIEMGNLRTDDRTSGRTLHDLLEHLGIKTEQHK
jgi:hypothetical protein